MSSARLATLAIVLLSGFLVVGGVTAEVNPSSEPPVEFDVDGTDPSAVDPTAPPAASSASRAPVLASAQLADGTTLELVAPSDDSLAVIVGGPIEAAGVDLAMRSLEITKSPASFYETVTGRPAPKALVAQSRRVVASQNWQASGTFSEAGSPAKAPTKDALQNCDKLTAGGQGNLHGNWGNCALYFRDSSETTNWTHDDVLGIAAHVIGVSGTHYWEVMKKNCSSCDWTVLYDKVVAAGYHYYYHYSNVGNDFKSYSRVTSLSNGASHYHDSARCHDYKGRAQWGLSTLAGGCFIRYGTSSPELDVLYCQEMGYIGIDPSNIYTAYSWGGNGTPLNCS